LPPAAEGDRPTGSTIGFARGHDGAVFLVTGFTYDSHLNPTPNVYRLGPEIESIPDLPTDSEDLRTAPGGAVSVALHRLWLRRMSYTLDEDRPSTVSGRTKFEPYQFRPLLKYIASPQKRLLIADEAGLGKTIEAGYILVEELLRHPLRKVLVLCPSHLKAMWRRELWWKFGLPFRTVTSRGLLEALTAKTGGFHLIASLDVMRNRLEESRRAVSSMAGDLDMLIIDEVHHLIGRSGETLRRRLGTMLSLRSRRVIALSATPVQIDVHDLERVLSIVDPVTFVGDKAAKVVALNAIFIGIHRVLSGDLASNHLKALLEKLGKDVIESVPGSADSGHHEGGLSELVDELTRTDVNRLSPEQRDRLRSRFDRIAPLYPWMTRTRRVEVGQFRHRDVEACRVSLNSDTIEVGHGDQRVQVSERGLYRDIDELFVDCFYFNHRCQLASCLSATSALLQHGARGFNFWLDGKKVLTDEEVRNDFSDGDRLVRLVPRLDSQSRRRCDELWKLSRLLSIDTKWTRFLGTLEGLRKQGIARKVVVFTQWRPTLDYFRLKSSELNDVRAFYVSGSDSEWARNRTVDAFSVYDGFAILFASDVLAEGLDLVAADCVLNYDLPLNPQRLEQRISRVDRYGQKSDRIKVVNFMVEGGLDAILFDLLLSRIDAFTTSIGTVADSLTTKFVEKGSIDANEVVRLHREVEDRRLLEESTLLTADGFLDIEIKRVNSQERYVPPSALRDIFYHFVVLLLGPTQVARVGQASIAIHSPDAKVAEVLANLCGAQLSAEIQDELQQVIHGGIPITFSPQETGYFLALRHPLVHAVQEIMGRVFGDQINESTLVVRDVGKPHLSRLVVEELVFEGEGETNRTWLVKGLSKDGRQVIDLSPAQALQFLTSLRPAEADFADGIGTSRVLEDAVAKAAGSWFDLRESLSRNTFINDAQSELARLSRLRETLSEHEKLHSGQARNADIERRIAAVRARLDEVRVSSTQHLEFMKGRSRLLSMVVEGFALEK
jgi:superfamily II DNA or RNA helicase